MLKLYNTESREKEEVRPHAHERIKMYTCGPTIYDFAHIGNFRNGAPDGLVIDVGDIHRLFDGEAKILNGPAQQILKNVGAKKIPLKEYTEPYRKAFFEDLQTLGIEKVEYYPAATDYIPQMIEMIQQLLDKGFAYKSANGSIYFSIRKCPSYGRLSHLNLADLKVNASGDNEADEYDKDNIADFVLWKAYDPERDGQIFWESPFGPGRPGWHIECSAMATQLLGDTLDIHCGGVDNMFPHHENEIAQSECCTGHRFVHHWIHVEHLLVDHKKMSKSLGNFYTLRDLLKKGYTGSEVRYLLLSTHYRTQLNFTFAGLDAARSSLQRIEDLILRLKTIQSDHLSSSYLPKAKDRFKTALADDLNISAALAALFDLIRELNTLADENKLGRNEAQEALQLLADWDRVLAVLPLHKKEPEAPADLLRLLERREAARQAKDWRVSDEMRDAILARGYVIEDTPQGARLKKK